MGLKIKNRFLIFWSILGASGLILIWNLPWRFQVNDDEVMMWLVSGAYTGKPEWFAVFLHPSLSWLFSKLYLLAPAVRWYPLAWFLILFVSFLVFVILVQKRTQSFGLKTLWVLFAFAFFVHFLFFVQFSIVSAFAVTVGLAARFSRPKPSMISIFSEDFLILIGFLIRPDVLILFLVGTLVVFGIFFRNKQVLKLIFMPLILWGLGMAISWIWLEESGLQKFQEINQLRSQVFDHPALQLHKNDIKDLEPELYFFSNGLIDFWTDTELIKKLPGWKDILDQKRLDLISPNSVFLALSTYIFHEHFLLGWISVFLAFSFLWNLKKSGLLFLLILGVLILATPFYLIKVQIYGILFLFFFLIVFLTNPTKQPVYLFNWGFLIVLCVGLGFHFYSFFQSSNNLIAAENLRAEINEFGGEGQIYIVGKGEYYRDLRFDQPLQFKILGWPTLLERHYGIEKVKTTSYFVDSATYFGNLKYFEKYVRMDSQTSMILLIKK